MPQRKFGSPYNALCPQLKQQELRNHKNCNEFQLDWVVGRGNKGNGDMSQASHNKNGLVSGLQESIQHSYISMFICAYILRYVQIYVCTMFVRPSVCLWITKNNNNIKSECNNKTTTNAMAYFSDISRVPNWKGAPSLS